MCPLFMCENCQGEYSVKNDYGHTRGDAICKKQQKIF